MMGSILSMPGFCRQVKKKNQSVFLPSLLSPSLFPSLFPSFPPSFPFPPPSFPPFLPPPSFPPFLPLSLPPSLTPSLNGIKDRTRFYEIGKPISSFFSFPFAYTPSLPLVGCVTQADFELLPPLSKSFCCSPLPHFSNGALDQTQRTGQNRITLLSAFAFLDTLSTPQPLECQLLGRLALRP